jgi:Leucine-rich repeat (LRR) protein
VSLLIFRLSGIDGKVLTCSEAFNPACTFENQVLGANDVATFAVSPGLNPAKITVVYFNLQSSLSSIYYIPASIFTYFPNLSGLGFLEANLQEIRRNTFLNAKNLESFSSSKGNIPTLEADTFKGATKLSSLELGTNQMKSIDVNAFRGLPELNELFLDSNKLTTLDPQTFATLNSLKFFSLLNNQISSLDKDIFRKMVNLTNLYLGFNNLQTLDPTIFSNNKKLRYVSLNNNKINAISNQIFKNSYDTLFILDLSKNICVDVKFELVSFANVTVQRSLESALETCNSKYIADDAAKSSQLLKNVAKLLNNFFVAVSLSALNLNNVLSNYTARILNTTQYV